MPIRRLYTRHDPQILIVPVQVAGEQNIRVVVVDEDKPTTILYDRCKDVKGSFNFSVRMPMAPMWTLVYVYNTENGLKDDNEDSSFTLVDIRRKELERKLDEVDMNNPAIKSFVEFAQRFAYNAGNLKAGGTLWNSDDKRYYIRYVDEIVDDETKQPIPTPLRVSVDSGLIEASAKDVRTMPFPRIFALLCHEFAHKYLNNDMNNEVEADLRGLLLYLSLGYPRVEGCEAFLNHAFADNPTEQNKERTDIIIDFVENFDKQNHIFYE